MSPTSPAPAPELATSELAQLSPAEKRALLGRLLAQRRGPDEQASPLSYAQRRLYFLERMDPGRPVYNISRAVHLVGPLPPARLKATLDALVARHEALRTRFDEAPKDHPEAGQPLQWVAARRRLSLPTVDLSALAPGAAAALATRFARAEARRPFDLGRAPLLRARLLRLADAEHRLLLTFHHIVVDGWSVALFFRELAEIYRGLAEGRPPALAALPIRYTDFARWQHQELAGEVGERQLAYWRARLADLPDGELPPDRPRSSANAFAGDTLPLRFLGADAEPLRRLAREGRATVFMVVVAAWKALFHRLTGDTDVAVGCGIANRNQKEIEPLLGFFVNSLILRTDLDGGPSFAELLTRVRATALAAYAQQDLPFDKLVEELNPERYLNHNPLFRIILAMQTLPAARFELPGLVSRLEPVHSGTSKFDLFLDLKESGDGFEGMVEFSTGLFDRTTVARWVGALGRLLAAAATDPGRPIATLPLASPAERQQLLVEWNDSASAFPAERTVAQLFAERAAEAPERIALVAAESDLHSSGEHWSYGAAAARVAHQAATLRAQGLAPGTLAAVRGERSVDLVLAFLAVAHAGAAFLPLEAGLPPERLHRLLELAGARLFLGTPPTGLTLPAGIPRLALPIPEAVVPLVPLGDGGDLAYVMFTSGSTGRPKGVAVPHRAIARLVLDTQFARFGPAETFLLLAPTSFDASTLELWGALATGGRLVVAPPEQPSLAELAALLERERISALWLTAGLFHQMVDEELPRLARVPQVLAGGDVLSPSHVQRFLQAGTGRLVNGYGPTENTTFTCCHPMAAGETVAGPVPIGRPIAATEVLALDRALEPVPLGGRGELFAAGAGLALGYLGDPRQTAERFRPDPRAGRLAPAGSRIYATGDLVRYGGDGRLAFVGRRDSQIKVRGFRVELAEIEQLLTRHPAVEAATVIRRELAGEDGAHTPPALVAYVVANPDYAGATAEREAIGTEQIDHWQVVFDEAYGHFKTEVDPTFNVAGWNSSYTGLPIPAADMHEWREATVARIAALGTSGAGTGRVLEIGCGTGLLLFRLAREAAHYVGTDFSAVALEHVRQHLPLLPHPERVHLEERRADELGDLAPGSFDVVVLNSVVQYFPNVDYLLRVLDQALEVVAPGGAIFLGDLRHLPLLEAFATGIERAHAEPGLATAELRRRVRRRLAREEELALDPALFVALARRDPRIARARVLAKHGRAGTEMNRYRFDAVLEVQAPGRAPALPGSSPPSVDYRRELGSLAALERRLEAAGPAGLLVTALPNRRVSADVEAARLMALGVAPEGVAELEELLERLVGSVEAERGGLEPQDLVELGARLGYRVELSWARSGQDGSLDVAFTRPLEGSAPALPEPHVEASRSLASLGNRPLLGRFARTLAPELTRFLSRELPDYMLPSTYLLLDRLPLTANGKVDRRALPQPELERLTAAEATAPRDPVEELIAGIWREVLGVASVGAHDSFFELGGHSLLATQVISRLKATFSTEVPLKALFAKPTVAGLAEATRRALAGGEAESELPLVASPRRVGEPVPASFAQERLWFLDQLAPGQTVYNMPAALVLEGELPVAALVLALGQVLARHEALRTRFVVVDGRPHQRVEPAGPLALPVLDLSGLAAAAAWEQAQALAAREIRRPFDLGRAPLLRASLVRLPRRRAEGNPPELVGRHVLLLAMHHAVSDGWSIGVLLTELAALLKAAVLGTEPPLAPLPLQYPDFALWQRQRLAGERLERLLGFWQNELAGAPTLLDLPLDRPRPTLQTYAGAALVRPLPAGLAEPLEALGRSAHATPFMLFLAAFQALLHRTTGARDLLLGSPIANRNELAIERLIGFFVNTLVHRGEPASHQTVHELLAEVRRRTLAAYAHQDLPFERLVEALLPERDPAVSPLFQVMFAVQNALGRLPELPGLALSRLPRRSARAMFDLSLSLEPTGFEPGTGAGQGWQARWVWNTDLFDRTTVERLARGYERLLLAALRAPETRLGELPLLTAAERQQLAVEWSDRPWDGARPRPTELVSALLRVAHERPEQIALYAEAGLLSYAGLLGQAQALAGTLVAHGVGPERGVVFFAERTPELVVGLLATWFAGGVYVPLSPNDPPDRLERILADLDRFLPAPVLLASEGLLERARLLEEPGRRRQLPLEATLAAALSAETQRSKQVPGAFQTASDQVPGAFQTASGQVPGAFPSPRQAAYVLYTSGSTGEPKGVLVEHRSLAHRIAYQAETELTPASRFLNKASLGFDIFLAETLSPLLAGASLVLTPPGSEGRAAAFAELLARHAITHASFPPTLLAELLAEPQLAKAHFLSWLFTGGETVPLPLARRVLAELPVVLLNRYGPTETTISVTSWRCGSGLEARSLPIGRTVAGARLFVLDASLTPAPRDTAPLGTVGELFLGEPPGEPLLARGYLGRPGLTAERFLPNPFARTPEEAGSRLYASGDLARFRPDGALEFAGRRDGQVKIRGLRVELGEVEAAVGRLPGVAQAAVIDVPDPATGSRKLAAFLVHGPGEPLPTGTLRRMLAERLPQHMIPSLFLTVPELPLTGSGKVDKKRLSGLAAHGHEPAETVEPASALERTLASLFVEILGNARVGRFENFFELGGNSLSAVRLCGLIEQRLGVPVPIAAVFEHGTVEGLAAFVAASTPGATRPEATPAALPESSPVAAFPSLSFAQQRLWVLQHFDRRGHGYNLPLLLALTGPLAVRPLAQALAALEARHAVLRTTIGEHDGRPFQHVHAAGPVLLPVVDLGGLIDPEPVARALAERETRRPFDLESGPVHRERLLRLDADRHVLTLTFHHIAVDGWSIGVYLRELSELYRAFQAGLEAALPALSLTYIDFAREQQERLTSEQVAGEVEHWRRFLADAPAVLELPLDRPRPAVAELVGASVGRQLPPAVLAELERTARASGATLFMVAATLWAALLSRLSGQSIVPLGTPIAGRSRPELEPLIGLFVNTLVLPLDLRGEPTLPAALTRARDTILSAFAHQELPFEKLVEALEPERSTGHTPIFQALIVLQNAPREDLALPGLAVERWENRLDTAKLDLSLSLQEGPSGLSLALEHDLALFETTTAERWLGWFAALCQAALRAPETQPLGSLPLLSPTEQAELAAHASGPPAFPAATLATELLAAAERHPERVALVWGEERWSYAGLLARAVGLATDLRSRGVGPDVRVLVTLERSSEAVAAFLAVLLAGGTYVPLDLDQPAERQALVVDQADAALSLTRDDLPALAAWPRAQPAAPPALEVDHLAYVLFTSGSTGRPKGVAISHRSAANVLRALASSPELPNEPRWLAVTSFTFDISVAELFVPWLCGGRIELTRREDAADGDRLATLLEERRIEVLQGTHATWRLLLAAGWPPTAPLVGWIGGEALDRDLAERLLSAEGLSLRNFYGPTETAISATAQAVPAPLERLPIGRPLAGYRAEVLDAGLQPVLPGAVGEIYLGGSGLARGYLGRPGLTADRFRPGPGGERRYRTGDRGRMLPGGALLFQGRLDSQVKVRGFRIELGEVEAALAACPEVAHGVVVARPDGRGSSQLVAYWVPRPGSTEAPEVLREQLTERLPPYMIPAAFVALPALPVLANGKLDRKSLPEPTLDRREAAPVEAGDALERQLVALFEEVLAVHPVGVTDNFFALGGTSVTAVELVSLIRRRIGHAVPVAALFQGGTVAAVKAVLRDHAWPGVLRKVSELPPPRVDIVAVKPTGDRTPFFMATPLGGILPSTAILGLLDIGESFPADVPFYAIQLPGLAQHLVPFVLREEPLVGSEIDQLLADGLDDRAVERTASEALTALRKVRPSGPYVLSGFCSGGLVAYEMARQLRLAGESVELVLLDTVRIEAAAAGSSDSSYPPAGLLAWFVSRDLNEKGVGMPTELEGLRQELGSLPPARRFARATEELHAAGIFSASSGEAELARLFQTYAVNLRTLSHALRSYQPASFPGSIQLLRTHHMSDPAADATLGWRDLVTGSVTVQSVPGDHGTLFLQPHLTTLIERLVATLPPIVPAESAERTGWGALVDGTASPSGSLRLVPLRTTATLVPGERPLFLLSHLRALLPTPFMHGFVRLSEALPPGFQIYSVQLPGLMQDVTPRLLGPGPAPDLEATIGSHRLEEMAEEVLTHLQRVQPHGPYRLGGSCTGGLVAFEVARRLRAKGEAIDTLVLLDSVLPELGGPLSAEPESTPVSDTVQPSPRSLAWFIARAMNETGRPLTLKLDELANRLAELEPDSRWVEATAAAQRAGLVAATATPRELERTFELYLLNRQLLATLVRSYRPATYDGPLTLVRAADLLGHDEDPTLGWQRVATHGVNVLTVPGNHESLLNHQVGEVARAVVSALGLGKGGAVVPEALAERYRGYSWSRLIETVPTLPAPEFHLLSLRATGTERPLFLVAHVRGILPVPPLAGFANVCQALPDALPVFAVQLPGLAQHLTQDLLGDQLDDETIEAILEQGLDPHAIEHAAANVLEKIRSVQPHGPYRLGSWCTGGLVTFEVAQQLRRQGEEVECLVLVDSFLPAPATAVSAEDPGPSVSDLTQTTAASLVWFVCRSLNERGRRLPFDLDDLLATLEGLPPAERWQAALDAAKQAQLVGPDTTTADLERTYRLYRANQRAVARILRNYRAEPYEGPLAVIRAKRLNLRDSGETLGWNRVATQPIDVIEVPGDHGTVLNRHAKEVAAGFLRALGRGSVRPGGPKQPA